MLRSSAIQQRRSCATQFCCSSHIITCDWDTVVLLPHSHSRCSLAVSATLVVIMLPRIRFSMPRAQLAESAGSEGGSGALSTASVGQCGVTACRISNISFSYQLL